MMKQLKMEYIINYVMAKNRMTTTLSTTAGTRPQHIYGHSAFRSLRTLCWSMSQHTGSPKTEMPDTRAADLRARELAQDHAELQSYLSDSIIVKSIQQCLKSLTEGESINNRQLAAWVILFYLLKNLY